MGAVANLARRLLAVVTLALFAAACTADGGEGELGSGYAASAAGTRSVALRDRPQIYLFRGGFNGAFSTGINEMVEALAARGVPARALSWSARDASLEEIRKAHAAGYDGPVVLAGHSLGAGTVHAMVRELTDDGIGVDLAIVFDPLGAIRVPAGVDRFVNYKASGDRDDPGRYRPGRGFDGQIVNVDIRNLPELGAASHWNIVNQKALQERVVDEIVAVYRRRR
ncbi:MULTISPECIES: hypothetical protein [unclassified Roseitalea]|uniref:hypothetical protein n=1 Tax=unclassified Roseitalea TaxID=2639107 RepID=UPI00273FBA07|nr:MULTISPECIES: hypothetical protein [unclassified Roseitalea]